MNIKINKIRVAILSTHGNPYVNLQVEWLGGQFTYVSTLNQYSKLKK